MPENDPPLSTPDPGELLARAMHTDPHTGGGRWTPPEPEELARLLPQYHIERLLGHGGMGAVYKGRQAALDRAVAIKLLPAELADFGLARPIQEESTMLTGTNVVMGTADYMAPEQQEGHADQRADIYALGVMLYEMLCGQRPRGAFDPPSHRVQVDVRLDVVVLKTMQQAPERRYQQVSEMKTDVDRIRTTPIQKGKNKERRFAIAAP